MIVIFYYGIKSLGLEKLKTRCLDLESTRYGLF